jgi:uncharacterized protein YjdB
MIALLAACSDGPTAPAGPTDPETPTEPDTSSRVASVAVAPGSLSLMVGGSYALVARPLDRDGHVLQGYPIGWTSADTSVATVSPAGMVTARGAGTAAIRATSAGKSGEVVVRVVAVEEPAQPTVAWILITPAGGTIPWSIGTPLQLGVVARAADGTEIVGRPVAWSSGNVAVASIDGVGLLQAHAPGTAWIRAEVDGRRDSTLVSVGSLIARVENDPDTVALGVGDGATITARAFDVNGGSLARTFSWSSSNDAVATVDATGRVIATGAGTALITAVSEGKRATTLVTVTGERWRMIDAAGSALPAIADTTTITVGGVARPARFQVTGGTIRIRNGRYELRIEGWLLADGLAPVATTVGSDGVIAYDMFSGDPLFFEGDEWANRQPRFRGRVRESGALQLDWNRTPGAPVVPLGFAR